MLKSHRVRDPELKQDDHVGDGGVHHAGDQGFVHLEEPTSSERDI